VQFCPLTEGDALHLFKWVHTIFEPILWILVGPVAQSVWRVSHGLDGPGSNPGGDGIFRPSRPALWPTQPPVQWVPDLSRG